MSLRRDLALIADMVPAGARVLDVGCGDGALLEHLARTRNVDGRGIELSQAGVNACVARGLSVVQGDADTDLADYPSGAFDLAILSQTIQATERPKTVLTELLRIGRRVIVSFPNFGYWRVRLGLGLGGRMPQTAALPHVWYESPNIHLCTIDDFLALTGELGVTAERALALGRSGRVRPISGRNALSNLMSESAILLLRKS